MAATPSVVDLDQYSDYSTSKLKQFSWLIGLLFSDLSHDKVMYEHSFFFFCLACAIFPPLIMLLDFQLIDSVRQVFCSFFQIYFAGELKK